MATNYICAVDSDCTTNTALGSLYECRWMLDVSEFIWVPAQCIVSSASPYIWYNDLVYYTEAMPTSNLQAYCVNALDCEMLAYPIFKDATYCCANIQYMGPTDTSNVYGCIYYSQDGVTNTTDSVVFSITCSNSVYMLGSYLLVVLASLFFQ
mmetsp:Transcript_18017/g.17197  ORF Transcript_18017/g.17197 Transcript_18017/m.17197 type:complete len:152 (+) Transcript_18017:300-755(+)